MRNDQEVGATAKLYTKDTMKCSLVTLSLALLVQATDVTAFAVKQGVADPKTAVLLPDYASNDPDPVGKSRSTVSDTTSSLVHMATRSQDAAHKGIVELPPHEEPVYVPAVAHLKRNGAGGQYSENKLGDKKVAVLLPDWASNYPVPNGGKRSFQPSLMK